MRYEWDEHKNEANIVKHKVGFEEADKVFQAFHTTVLDDRYDYGEDRWIAVGLLNTAIVYLVYTEPGEDTRRIISLRKATPYEQREYADALQDELGGV